MRAAKVKDQVWFPESDTVTCREEPLWRGAGAVWRQLYGSFRDKGLSFEWHEFKSDCELDWARSFHATSVEICLNLTGLGIVRHGKEETRYASASAGFYVQGANPLQATRLRNDVHRFITVEFAPSFLSRHLAGREDLLHPLLRKVLEGKESSGLSSATSLTTAQRALAATLRNPSIYAAAQPLWYEAKALELMAEFFVQLPAEEEFFCRRQKRLARERAERVASILREKIACPPSLEEIAREVGCSPFYLSRTFSKEMGLNIPQFLRQLRLERAAELLKSGKFNVTEAAFEVGYSSLSHFSSAFHEMFGCCPGLYPLKTNLQPRRQIGAERG